MRLGHHLIARYWSGEINFDSGDQLIHRFYQRASTAVREQMTQYIGWNLLKPEVGTDQAVLSRLARLWDKRLAAASPSADRDELVRFGEWFASGRFDDDWSLRQLARVITLTSDVKPDILGVAPPGRNRSCPHPALPGHHQRVGQAVARRCVGCSARGKSICAGSGRSALASPTPGTKALAGEISTRRPPGAAEIPGSSYQLTHLDRQVTA